MSALGQKQTLERALRMSALPPKADIPAFRSKWSPVSLLRRPVDVADGLPGAVRLALVSVSHRAPSRAYDEPETLL